MEFKSVLDMPKKVIDNICSGCGLCESVCTHGCIEIVTSEEGFSRPRLKDETKCIQCGLCIRYCPGLQKDKMFDLFDNNQSIYYGHSIIEKHRFEAASGGITSEFLAYILKQKIVDYVVVSDAYNNNRDLSYKIIENYREIFKYSGSNYCPVPMGQAIKEIKSRAGKGAIVCLPCLAKGIRKVTETDAVLGSKLVYIVSLLCNHVPSYNATEYLLRKNRFSLDLCHIKYRGQGWFGSFRAKNERDELKIEYGQYYSGNFAKFFWQERCLSCVDHFGSNADISFGDADFVKYREKSNIGETICFVSNIELKNILSQMQSGKKILLRNDISNDEIIDIYGPLIESSVEKRKKLYGKNKFEMRILLLIESKIALKVKNICVRIINKIVRVFSLKENKKNSKL